MFARASGNVSEIFMCLTTPALFTSTNDDWATPSAIITFITGQYGPITLDAAAAKNTAHAPYFGPDHVDPRRRDALDANLIWADTQWHAPNMPSHTFVNPPYGRRMNPWVDHALECAWHGVPVTLLLPARTDTQAFQRLAQHAHAIHLISGRLNFTRPDGQTGRAPFPSVIIHLTPSSVKQPTTEDWVTLTHR